MSEELDSGITVADDSQPKAITTRFQKAIVDAETPHVKTMKSQRWEQKIEELSPSFSQKMVSNTMAQCLFVFVASVVLLWALAPPLVCKPGYEDDLDTYVISISRLIVCSSAATLGYFIALKLGN